MSDTTVSVKVNLGILDGRVINFTRYLEKAGELIAAESRGNITKGVDVDGNGLTPNKPATLARKQANGWGSKPLVAEYGNLKDPSKYKVKTVKMNHVRVGLTGIHPKSGGLTNGQIAWIHNTGAGKNPVREFFGVSIYALKRIQAMMNDGIKEIFGREYIA